MEIYRCKDIEENEAARRQTECLLAIKQLRQATQTPFFEHAYPPARVMHKLKEHPYHLFTASDLAACLGLEEKNVRVILNRLYKEDKRICRALSKYRNHSLYYYSAEKE